MKRLPSLTLIAVTLGVFFGPAQSGHCQSDSEEVFRKRTEESFRTSDIDKDGYLQGGEIPERIRRILAQAMASPNTRISLAQYLNYQEVSYQISVSSAFKDQDRNADGFLQDHEVPLPLLNSLSTHGSRAGISFKEYLKFCRGRDFPVPRPSPPRLDPSVSRNAPTTATLIVDQTEYEKRPVVYRAGKLPPGLPDWFEQLDTDKDGQIALYEWRKGNKSLEEFERWDRNDDGLMTFDEVLHKLKLDRAPSEAGQGS